LSTNKHAIIRYQTLDKCFHNPGRRYFIEDLVEACNNSIYEFTGTDTGIQKRQIFEDIKFMESTEGWNVPLERIRDGHRVFYRYSDKAFSINNRRLNETEENQLKEALLTLSRFKGMPQFEWVDEIAARLDSGLDLSKSNSKIIEFEQNNYLKGLEFITPIYNAILYHKTITISYISFKKEEKQTFLFHPYFLKQFNNRWFVFGKNDVSGFIINLALDRIIKIEENKKKFIPNSEINFDDYFEDIIGVSLANNPVLEKIILKINNSLYPYIKSKPIHGSQKVKEKESLHTIITLELIPNYELESLILSYGEGVEVIAPKSLRNKIKKRLDLSMLNYKNKNAATLHKED
jgi:predicted DNA-binding transcriptional regulator YafY